MPPKKKAAGDATKGEKVFKNLCAICHSFKVNLCPPHISNFPSANFLISSRHMELVRILREFSEETQHQWKDLSTRKEISHL
jgi:cytochrome c553